MDSLGALSVPSDKIVLVEGTVYCRKLYFGHTSALALTRDVAFQHSYGRLIELAAEGRDVSLPRRFYISRRDTTRRAMRDESQFEAEMTALGIVPVVLSQLNLLQKVDLFQNADLVVGAHGAGLSHLVFAKPGLQVIEIMPASKHRIMEMGIRVCFSAIARVKGLDYTMILTTMDPKTGMWSGSDQLTQAIAANARPA
ncbi:glycosyltransferase family 61 protein [Methylobacterium sp. W2]|uniref:glycosyltransferase family 61 protein n=1 Tax=Methylobacterium sp. W2 TaxID=2598107 RepID=UPI001D0C5E01|nr:glycosyltransferase family 61 protein [Methylobacterium sp. W2]